MNNPNLTWSVSIFLVFCFTSSWSERLNAKKLKREDAVDEKQGKKSLMIISQNFYSKF